MEFFLKNPSICYFFLFQLHECDVLFYVTKAGHATRMFVIYPKQMEGKDEGLIFVFHNTEKRVAKNTCESIKKKIGKIFQGVEKLKVVNLRTPSVNSGRLLFVVFSNYIS